MTTLGELTQEILKRKSRLSIYLMQLEHLEEMYLSNDAGASELMLSHTDGGRVPEVHISEYRDELLEQIDEATAELTQMEQVKLPVILPKLLSGEDPEDPSDPDDDEEEAEEEVEDDVQGVFQFGTDEADDAAQADEVEADGDGGEEDLDDEEEGETDGDEEEPNARAG